MRFSFSRRFVSSKGANYFKLRDIAEILDFGVKWIPEREEIEIRTDQPYSPEQ